MYGKFFFLFWCWREAFREIGICAWILKLLFFCSRNSTSHTHLLPMQTRNHQKLKLDYRKHRLDARKNARRMRIKGNRLTLIKLSDFFAKYGRKKSFPGHGNKESRNLIHYVCEKFITLIIVLWKVKVLWCELSTFHVSLAHGEFARMLCQANAFCRPDSFATITEKHIKSIR